MIFECVNFNEEEVRKMSLADFKKRHINLFWLDRDEETRGKMLEQVYGLIKPAKGKRKAEK